MTIPAFSDAAPLLIRLPAVLSVQVFCSDPGAVDGERRTERRDPRVVERAVDGRGPADVERAGDSGTRTEEFRVRAPRTVEGALVEEGAAAGRERAARRRAWPPGWTWTSTLPLAPRPSKCAVPSSSSENPAADHDRAARRATPPGATTSAPVGVVHVVAVRVAPGATQSVPPCRQRVDTADVVAGRRGRSRPGPTEIEGSVGDDGPVRRGALRGEVGSSGRRRDQDASRRRPARQRGARPLAERSIVAPCPPVSVRPPRRHRTWSGIQDKSDAQRSYSTTTGAWSENRSA